MPKNSKINDEVGVVEVVKVIEVFQNGTCEKSVQKAKTQFPEMKKTRLGSKVFSLEKSQSQVPSLYVPSPKSSVLSP